MILPSLEERRRRSDKLLAMLCVLARERHGWGLVELVGSVDIAPERVDRAIREGRLFEPEDQIIQAALIYSGISGGIGDVRREYLAMRHGRDRTSARRRIEYTCWRFILKAFGEMPVGHHIPLIDHCVNKVQVPAAATFARAARMTGPQTIVAVAHEYQELQHRLVNGAGAKRAGGHS